MSDVSSQVSQEVQPMAQATTPRKVTAALFIALDGVTEAPDQWQFDHFDEDMAVGMGTAIAEQDTVLLGRVTYQEWANYWPTATDEPYASHINNVPKVVFSTTMDRVAWGDRGNVRLAQGTPAQEIARLKQQPGKTIAVAGSPTLVRSLLEDDLIDELMLLVHPVVAGRGKKLFDGETRPQRMELVYSQITRTGVAILIYQPKRNG